MQPQEEIRVTRVTVFRKKLGHFSVKRVKVNKYDL